MKIILNYLLTIGFIGFQYFCDAQISNPIPVNWSNIVTTPRSSDKLSYLTICECDLTQNYCDNRCCCDKDCTLDFIAYFLKNGQCTNSSVSSTLDDLWCSSQVIKVNDRYASITKADTLCIVKANNPIKGVFYDDFPADVTLEVLFKDQIAQNALNLSKKSVFLINAIDPTTKPTELKPYNIGDFIRTAPVDSPNALGYFFIPNSYFSQCSDESTTARFLMDDSYSCGRLVVDPGVDCSNGSFFDSSYYTQQTNILKTPLLEDAFALKFGSLKCNDGKLITNCPFNEVPSPKWDSTTNMCSWRVSQVDYTFTYAMNTSTQSLQLIGAEVSLVLKNDFLIKNSFIDQSFSIKFSSQKISISNSLPKKSGNPGYISGYPILIGSLHINPNNSTIRAIQTPNDSNNGMTFAYDIPTSTYNQIGCPSPQNFFQRKPIKFGIDLKTGCTLYYNLESVSDTDSCAKIRKLVYDIQTMTIKNITHVGRFGNASYLNLNDWVPVINNIPSLLTGAEPYADTQIGKCSNLLTDFQIQVLTSKVGSKYNPQTSIVGLRFVYNAGTFSYKCKNSCTLQSKEIKEQKISNYKCDLFLRCYGECGVT